MLLSAAGVGSTIGRICAKLKKLACNGRHAHRPGDWLAPSDNARHAPIRKISNWGTEVRLIDSGAQPRCRRPSIIQAAANTAAYRRLIPPREIFPLRLYNAVNSFGGRAWWGAIGTHDDGSGKPIEYPTQRARRAQFPSETDQCP
jgi:hypothetical protein